ncbi:MAG: M23 family metallopeptidase [Pseudomonadota bacterium]|nr:M23 family metallopeptidase [Pseudomonadota bacterium]
MGYYSTHAGLFAVLLVTAACSQQPAPIDMKGQFTYGRSGANASYAANGFQPDHSAPVYTSAADTQPVVVSDLNTLAPAAGAPLAPVSKPAPTSDVTVSQLDRVIGNDSAPVPASKPAPRQVARAETFMWPVATHKIISGFGPKGGGKSNDGINIASPEGEPVWAAADGEVVYAGNELAGYGNMVLIKHAGNKTTAYAHMSRATVDKHDHVKQGDIIGYVGATGNVKEPQLHFAIRDGKEPIDPAKYLSRSVAGL